METVSLLNDLNPAALFDSPAFDFPDALSSQKREVFSSSREWTIGFPLAKRRNAFLKRIIDITGAALLILLTFPWFLPLVAICIKLDSKGPVFFTQRRSKKAGRQFTCIKLRTMVENAEAHSVAAYENDPRITRFGAFLRRNHLDELTQLINVLLGDMSLIGPRPYMITDNERCEAFDLAPR